MAPLGDLDVADVREVARRIRATAQDQDIHKATLEKISDDLNRLCSLYNAPTRPTDTGQPEAAAVSDVASAVDECVQYLDEMDSGERAIHDAHASNVEVVIGGLVRCSRNLLRALGDPQDMDAEPPSYDVATDSNRALPRPATRHAPYSDDKASPLLPQPSRIHATGSNQRPRHESRSE